MDKLKEFFKIYKNPLIITLIIVGTSILLILILTFIFNRIIKRQKINEQLLLLV